MVQTLVVQHLEGSDPPQFQVGRISGTQFKTCPAVAIAPPDQTLVGQAQRPLTVELRWYLERFLEYPFPPETDHAEAVQRALRGWGQELFNTLFHAGQARDFYRDSVREGLPQLLLQISSDDPRILAWPWEALEYADGQRLAQTCRLERRLNQPHDPVPLSDRLPRERVEILLVTCRPYEADVGYRSISRPLVELIRKERLPARVTVLRPPTLDQLRTHLRANPDRYHVLHFDGHGAYGTLQTDGAGGGGSPAGPNAPHLLQGTGPQGYLVFEDAQGIADSIPAEKLGSLLYEHRLPAVVLNACQSATIDGRADNAFASVAGALLKGGVRSVTAMAYALYVSGAQQFLPAFYRRLFETGEFSEAARAGRQQMLQHDRRVCARGRYPLEDWLVPVLYEQGELDLSFAKSASGENIDRAALPDLLLPYGFIGRDGLILQLERALHRAPPVLLITGLGGVGKTTLAYGFAEWLIETQGLEGVLVWQDFRKVGAAESVINRMGEAFFGSQFSLVPLEQRLDALEEVLKDQRSLIVWDNFEAVWGIPGTSLEPQLPEKDRRLLQNFVRRLAGGKTKVLLTSRSDEAWLAKHERYRLPMAGLQGEERWEYCESVLKSLGKTINRKDEDLVKLLNLLQGHPLAMRVILPELEGKTAGSLLAALEGNLGQFAQGEDGADERALFATLKFAIDAVPESLRPLLVPLALHEGFVDGDYLFAMAQQVDSGWDRGKIDQLLQSLCGLGLLSDRGQVVYELHPLVTRYLRQRGDCSSEEPVNEAWVRAFVAVIGSLANAIAPRELHVQRGVFFQHEGNFHAALPLAERLDMSLHGCSVMQLLGAYTQNTWNWPAATRWFAQLAVTTERMGREDFAAGAYHQLGTIAQEQRDFAGAEAWYRKSLEISERLGNDQYMASSYHQLGNLAAEQRDFAGAEAWYRKSLEISERLGNDQYMAGSYHQLGRIAEAQRDFAGAEAWYRKSLEISERLGNESGAAGTYHQLGIIAQAQREWRASGQWFVKAAVEFLRTNNPHNLEIAVRSFQRMLSAADEESQRELRRMWEAAGLPALPEMAGGAE